MMYNMKFVSQIYFVISRKMNSFAYIPDDDTINLLIINVDQLEIYIKQDNRMALINVLVFLGNNLLLHIIEVSICFCVVIRRMIIIYTQYSPIILK